MSEYSRADFEDAEYALFKHIGNPTKTYPGAHKIERIVHDRELGHCFESADTGGYYALEDYIPCTEKEYEKRRLMVALS